MAKLIGSRRPKKLPYDGVRNAWYSTLPDPKPARVLQQDVTADWAVLGGGTCGLTFARRLAELRLDDSIAVVEAMRVGYGMSGRNAGFMLKHHSHGGIKNIDAAKNSDRLFQTGQGYLRDIVEQHRIRCQWNDWAQIYVSASTPGEAHLDDVADGFQTLASSTSASRKTRWKGSPAHDSISAACASTAMPWSSRLQ